MIWLSDSARVKVMKIFKVGERSATINLSSSRKNREGDGYVYSSWGFASFVGDAFKSLDMLGEGDVIVLKKAAISCEPYEKDGEKTWGQPRITVFDFEVYRKGEGSSPAPSAAGAEIPEDDDIPF